MGDSEDESASPLHARSEGDHETYTPLGDPATNLSITSPKHKRARNHTFDQTLKARVLELAQDFAESPGLLKNLRGAGVSRERSAELAIEAVTQHCKSVSITRLAVKKRGRARSSLHPNEG